jgi:Flp pilus assembly protein TadG
MRLITPSTELHRTGERGQAIVIVGFMVVILIGFIGLAIDGGRLYWERRILQNAVDAAALAASDNYQDSQSITASQHSAATEYAANERLYGAPSAAPSWGSATVDVTWAGSTDKMHVVYSAAGTVSAFDVSSTHTIPLAFMMVLGVGNTAKVSASAQGHAKTGGTTGTALVTLSQGNCTGGGDSLSVQGAGTEIVVSGGNIQTNGSVNAAGNGISVGGNFSDNCTNPVPAGVVASGTETAGVAPVGDPTFSPGPLASYSSVQTAGANVVLLPGVYASDPTAGGPCYFMSPGIYQFNGGISDTGTDMSNQLRAPDEPALSGGAPNYNTSPASPQYWADCPGSFTVAAAASLLPAPAGVWGVMVTSTRDEIYPPGSSTHYPRESAPSTCRQVGTNGANQGIRVTINNAPGAQGYNVYMAWVASGNPCVAGPWGYVGHVNNGVTETQASLGTVTSPVYDSTVITSVLSSATISQACVVGASYGFGCAAATGQFGSANPPGDGGETAPLYSGGPPGPPARDIVADGGGDRANEHDCQPSTSTDPAAPCTGVLVTPGGVQAYFRAGACLSQTQKNLSWFGGFQFNNISVYAPIANTCNVTLSGQASFGTGTIYWPGGNWTVTGNGGAPLASQVIVNTFVAKGNGVLTIAFDQQVAPAQGYSQISA